MKPHRNRRPLAVAALSLCAALPLSAQSFLVPPGITPSPQTGTCNSFPFDTTDMRYQVLVTAADLGGAATTISGLALAPCTNGVRVMTNLRIRMAHLSGGTLSHTFATNLTSPGPAQVVLDTTDLRWIMVADAWNEIGLQTPFAFNGTDNLVIEVLVLGTSGDPGAVQRASTNQRVYLGNYAGEPTGTSSGDMAFKMRIHAGDASVQLFGASCSGSNGRPRFTLGGSGRLTTPLQLACSSAPPSAPVIFTAGLSNALPAFPRDLAVVGASNCVMRHDIVASTIVLANATGDASLTLQVPGSPTLVGAVFYTSAIVWDPPANALGATLTNYGRVLIGN